MEAKRDQRAAFETSRAELYELVWATPPGQPLSSADTRRVLNWMPTHPGLLAGLENIQL